MKQKIVLIIGISLSLTFGVEAKNDKLHQIYKKVHQYRPMRFLIRPYRDKL